MMKHSYLFSVSRMMLLLILLFPTMLLGQKIRIQGKISDDQKRPLAGAIVVVKETNEVLGASDDDGLYSALVERGQVLVFESVGCASREVKVKDKLIINVTLETEAVRLQDVQVVAKLKNKVIPEPAEIEIKGNYFHMRTRVRVPKQMFKTNTRLIIQPFITDVTEKKRSTLSPLVMDGKEYTITQERMYGFDISKDPLIPYLYKQDEQNPTDLLPYHDSIYIHNQQNDYRGEVLISLENYNTDFYTDSFVIAKGIVNPLRFFSFEMGSKELLDSAFIPKPALQLRNDKGEVRLIFKPSKAQIDLDIEINAQEINKLKARLAQIEDDPNSNLQSFEISGIASPDGNYDRNLVLAQLRMKNALDVILSQLKPETRKYLKMKSDASVADWQMVVDMMKKDSLPQAAEVQAVINAYPKNITDQGLALRRKSFYKPLISMQYLPRLRRVEYQFEYSLFRTLKNDEILALYKKNASELTRYEYYRMFEMTKDTAKLRTLYVQALTYYPKFLLAANRLAALNLSQKRADAAVLEPFVSPKAPLEVLMNQTLTYLQLKQYNLANDISAMLPQTVETEEIRGIVGIFNGDYDLGYDQIVSKGGLNEVLLLLVMKRNQEAWEKAEKLPAGIALHEYVKAMAANRLDKVGQAIMYLENAFILDESLRDIATIDGDVNDLLE